MTAKEWWQETHGPSFELLRHFLLRFFDSEIVTTPGQMTAVLAGSIPVLMQWFLLLVSPMRRKYAQLAALPSADLYRQALRSDELWLITLTMAAIGLLTAIKWQSLFPNLRDYRTLGTLPLRPWQIFSAKLAALLIVAVATLLMVNLIPCVGFPPLTTGRWASNATLGTRILALAMASLAGCSFFFFALIALQGVLLNLLKPRLFGKVTGNMQGLLVATMLALLVMSFSLQPAILKVVLRPEFSRWLPPVWYLGLCQTMSGDPDPAMQLLASHGISALRIAVILALGTYGISYQRHQTLLVEGLAGAARDRRYAGLFANWLIPDPRRRAILSFMMKTLGRSSYHRTILMGYTGLGFAMLATMLIAMSHSRDQSHVLLGSFLYFHMITLIFLLLGTRHLFARPTEVKANWIFQMTEGEGREEWLDAVDSFVRVLIVFLVLLVPLPLELRYLGWQGVIEVALFAAICLLAHEWTFYSWNKLPFACSHLPETKQTWMIVAFFGLIATVIMVHNILLETVLSSAGFTCVIIGIVVLWARIRHLKQEFRSELRLKYDEMPPPAVEGLNLLH